MEYVLQSRESYEHKPHPYDNEPTVTIMQAMIAGVNCYWFTPEDPTRDRIIIYLHGGGFAMGSIRTHGRMVSHFAKKLHAKVLFVDYALAPENPYPAGLNDVLTVYRELASHRPGYQIDLIGDSAGGSLVVSAIGEMLKISLPLPDAVVLISPWIDLECKNPSIEENAQLDHYVNKDMLQMFALAYTGEFPLEVSSPGNAVLTQFPPVLIMVGTNEILLDDSKHFYNDIKAVQSRSKLSIYDDQPHLWLKKDIHKAASRRALAEIADFIRA
ncbi:MAG: alpha/beta hydrolase [Bacteroidota bacterium]|nr:alpha/beta hydrolase [Bacteroidota bacterium]MDP4215374.1 alpha/beta hydrolase [Bacteroidota bacterium]MDP4244518.1 alpha/beta hydrolase [Bacteroidota bacterium]MDP4253896.1 alpha/beta hydrolase [Bacteroidota bacterium]MDP4259934.1 alpha/beta hydrolase [Bacteroidota bacterium]